MDGNGLAETAHSPFERHADVILSAPEVEAENIAYGTPDHLLVGQAGELARAAPATDDPALLVADEEGGVGRRVIVVQQLKQEAETALRASLRDGAEAGRSLGGASPIATVRADEQMGH